MKENKIKISYRYLIKHFIFAIILSNAYIIFTNHGYNYVSIVDSMTITGIIYMIIGLFRIVMNLGFLNLFNFGFRKTWELITTRNYSKKNSKLGEYSDYISKAKSDRPYMEFLIIGLGLLALSILLINLNN